MSLVTVVGARLSESLAGRWFQRRGEAYRKERFVIRKEDDEDGRVTVTSAEGLVLRVD